MASNHGHENFDYWQRAGELVGLSLHCPDCQARVTICGDARRRAGHAQPEDFGCPSCGGSVALTYSRVRALAEAAMREALASDATDIREAYLLEALDAALKQGVGSGLDAPALLDCLAHTTTTVLRGVVEESSGTGGDVEEILDAYHVRLRGLILDWLRT